jgi:predicted TIM-barrel fold metal-dependent hydrolase
MAAKLLIDADAHVTEPPNLWLERIDRPFRERAPYVKKAVVDGTPGIYCFLEGLPPSNVAQGLGGGKRFDELPAFFREAGYEDARPGGWDPAERLKDMDIDGTQINVLYTTLGFRLFWLQDAALQRACFRVYNDWLAEYCAYAPERLIGLGLISLYDIDAAVQELRRCAKMGLRGALIWCSPPADRPYGEAMYDPLWATAQALDMPLSLHAITGMGPESRGHYKDRYIRFVAFPMEVQRSLTELIFSGVLERYPGLKIVSAENDIGWLPFFLQRLDGLQEEFRYLEPRALSLKPSEYFQRQIWACFITDPVGVANRHRIGVDNLMWSSDYPHVACTWPHSHDIIARDFQGVSDTDKWKIVRENVARLYSLA